MRFFDAVRKQLAPREGEAAPPAAAGAGQVMPRNGQAVSRDPQAQPRVAIPATQGGRAEMNGHAARHTVSLASAREDKGPVETRAGSESQPNTASSPFLATAARNEAQGGKRKHPLHHAPVDQDAVVDLAISQIMSATGDLAASEEQRKLLCLLSDGRLLVAMGNDRFSPHVLSYITLLERREVEYRPVQTRPARIIELYEKTTFNEREGGAKSDQATQAKTAARKIINDATALRASDIHLQVLHNHATLHYRVDGELELVKEYHAEFGMKLVRTCYQVLSDISGETFKEQERLDARIGRGQHLPPGLDGVRIATTPTAERVKMVMRLLYSIVGESFDVGELGFAEEHCEIFEALKELPIGLNIISGPTGSGKSTTLQRTLRGFISQTQGTKHVITVEDPPEYPIPGAVQTPVGNSATQAEREEKFTEAIRSAMRLDPDVIMIGEVRDLASAELALRAATTGHQVWTTLHANNALHCVDRLVNMGMDKDMLLDHTVLTGLVSQRLIRRLCPHCKKKLHENEAGFDKKRIDRLKHIFRDEYFNVHITGDGCDHCRGGNAGRTVVGELVRPDAHLCDLLRDGRRVEARAYWLSSLHGQTFMQHAINKIAEGIVDPFAAVRVLGPLITDAETLGVPGVR